MRTKPRSVALLLSLSSSGALLGCRPEPAPDPPSIDPGAPPEHPNVLVVLLDDVGIDHVSTYGVDPAAPPTPTLDALASEGMLFHNAYAMPTCTATRSVLLTGRHARRTGLGSVLWTDSTELELSLDEITLPEVLAQAPIPYRSGLAGKWHLSGFLTPTFSMHPRLSGFDWYAGSIGNLFYTIEGGAGLGYYDWEKVEADGTLHRTQVYATTDTVDDSLAQIAVMGEPFLFVTSFNAAHTPFHTPPEHLYTIDADTNLTRFDAAVEALDTEIGRLIDGIDPQVRARTLILVVGDNGTPDLAVTPPQNPNRAKGTVYEGGVRVPMLAVGPGVPAGTSSEALVSVVDLLPTLAQLAGVDLSAVLQDVPIDGVSFLPALYDPDHPGRSHIYTEDIVPVGFGPYTTDDRSLRDARYKLIRFTNGHEEFYDLSTTPFEEGEDLITPEGPPTDEAFAAYKALSAELDAIALELASEPSLP
ncbi:MAG TPA: hypothetical protein ENK18_27275 [Deltaproteobacteria bacterium]|nr:hypothetical protein [Deltaproteobacteria bacterium]